MEQNKKANAKTEKNSLKRFVAKPFGKFVASLFASWLIIGVVSVFLLYGPWSGLRDYIITSAMTTINHKHIARVLYPEKTIQKVMESNKVIDIEDWLSK